MARPNTGPQRVPTWVRYLGVVAVILVLSAPMAWCVLQLGPS